MHFASVFQDEVDDLPYKTGSEDPASHGTIRVVPALRVSVPRSQLYSHQRLLRSR